MTTINAPGQTCAWRGCGRTDVVAWTDLTGYMALYWCPEHADILISRGPLNPPRLLGDVTDAAD